ncbi:MAG: lysoplasmalogenase family protein, partial [Chloroflexota bacterium]
MDSAEIFLEIGLGFRKTALLTLFRPEWKSAPALLVSAGAFLFYLSDIALAWNRFVSPIRHGRMLNIGLYHLGQIA